MEIRNLSQREKQSTRTMYERIFTEDSREFVDYYYDYKTKDNEILVMEEDGNFQVMIHLNPFQASLCGEEVPVSYIVAVATDESVRRQGKMAELMAEALLFMCKKHQPFTFLMPANPPVYYSTGFRFLPKSGGMVCKGEPVAKIELAAASEPDVNIASGDKTVEDESLWEPLKSQEAREAADFANEILSGECDLFLLRDEAYYLRMAEETKSEGGGVAVLKSGGRFAGIVSYGMGEDAAEIQELICLSDGKNSSSMSSFERFAGKDAAFSGMCFMARILDIRMLGLMLKSEEPFCLRVKVEDDIISANNGCFEIKADKNCSSIASIEENETEMVMDIGSLTELLFANMRVFLREWV